MIRDYVANQSKDNNKISHRIMCSGYYSPHIKGDKYLSFKGGAKKGQIIVTMDYDLLLFLF